MAGKGGVRRKLDKNQMSGGKGRVGMRPWTTRTSAPRRRGLSFPNEFPWFPTRGRLGGPGARGPTMA